MGALSALRHTYAENEGPYEESLEIALCVHLIYADVRYDDEVRLTRPDCRPCRTSGLESICHTRALSTASGTRVQAGSPCTYFASDGV